MFETEKTIVRSFFRTRPNEELLRVARSAPRFYNSRKPNFLHDNIGCLVCHLTDNHTGGKYFDYIRTIPGAKETEQAYYDICTFTSEQEGGRIMILLAKEVLSERAVSNLVDELESAAPAQIEEVKERV